jgi:hypothetical protein
MLLGLFHKQSWGVTLFIVIPYTLVWVFFFSYDFRNLTLAVPFMGFSAAFGIEFLKKRFDTKKFPLFKIPKIPLIIFSFLLLVVMNFTVFKEDTLIRRQTRQKMKIGDAGLNDLLYRYHEKEGLSGKVATNYQYLGYLPRLEQFYYYHPGRVRVEFLDYLDTVEGKQIHYLLVPFILEGEKETYQRFREKIKSREYRLIFKWRGYWFVKVK